MRSVLAQSAVCRFLFGSVRWVCRRILVPTSARCRLYASFQYLPWKSSKQSWKSRKFCCALFEAITSSNSPHDPKQPLFPYQTAISGPVWASVSVVATRRVRGRFQWPLKQPWCFWNNWPLIEVNEKAAEGSNANCFSWRCWFNLGMSVNLRERNVMQMFKDLDWNVGF
jgi:hypothetical protein